MKKPAGLGVLVLDLAILFREDEYEKAGWPLNFEPFGSDPFHPYHPLREAFLATSCDYTWRAGVRFLLFAQFCFWNKV
jgi:hypothetical protein